MSDRPPPFEHIGRAIKLVRTRANLTQDDLSQMARITKAQASKYERGHQRPTLDSLDRVLMALGVDLFELAGVIEEIRHADRLRQEVTDDLPEAERRRAERRRARAELVHVFGRYLERLEESLECRPDEASRGA